jgi:hypothetical protein
MFRNFDFMSGPTLWTDFLMLASIFSLFFILQNYCFFMPFGAKIPFAHTFHQYVSFTTSARLRASVKSDR